jgi:uncharacterized transporter YbjL
MENSNSNPAAKMDAIREILFGQTVKEYSGQIENLELFLQNNHERTRQQIEEMQVRITEMLVRTENVFAEKLSQIEELTRNELRRQDITHIDRKQLSELLIQLGKQLNPVYE